MTLRTIFEIYFGINLFIAGSYWHKETSGKYKEEKVGEIIPLTIIIVFGAILWALANIEYVYIMLLKRRKI